MANYNKVTCQLFLRHFVVFSLFVDVFVSLNLDLRLLMMEDEFGWMVQWWWLCGSGVVKNW